MATVDTVPPEVKTSATERPGEVSLRGKRARPLLDPPIVKRAIADSFVKLNPRTLMKNPVMFVVEVGAAVTTILLFRTLLTGGLGLGFEFQIDLWLWFTLLFANFAEAMAEGRGKAQADALRRTKTETVAKKLGAEGKIVKVGASELRKGDIVLCDPMI